uniref:CPSF_A domain-containing protein n=1 Tax=Rhabditophanes sp. KR3021 TaxID=114890 RepID=A0AC35TTU5_9BILA
MYLYNLTLQPKTVISHAVSGHFYGNSKSQEIVVCRGTILQLLVPEPVSGKLSIACSQETFSSIREIKTFRLTGGRKDYIVVTSDSGRIAFLEYVVPKNSFQIVQLETYGKTGVRRGVAGEFIAVDPKGRSVMIASCEKQKLVYMLNRDSDANLTISSPLDASRSQTLCFGIIGLDVGYDNPTFAALEVELEDIDNDPSGESAKAPQLNLVYYELDLGLNHVVRKCSVPLPEPVNLMIHVPAMTDTSKLVGSILLCSQGKIAYKNVANNIDVSIAIPKRKFALDDDYSSSVIVNCHAQLKTKGARFFLLQMENGDMFKLVIDEDHRLPILTLTYFATVPPANSLTILKTGYIFVACEAAGSRYIQITKLDDTEGEIFASNNVEGDNFYTPRNLGNIYEVDRINALNPLMRLKVADMTNEGSLQFYALSGQGPSSNLKILRNGLPIREVAVCQMPGTPTGVFSVKKSSDDLNDAYIIVSFINATLVLKIGASVEEATNTGFLASTSTINACQFGEDGFVQVIPSGIRHITVNNRINEWSVPAKKVISIAAVKNRQVVICLSGTELIYFELDMYNQLNEYNEKIQLDSNALSMTLSPIPANEYRSRFLAVGCADCSVRIYNLDPYDCLTQIMVKLLDARPRSLLFTEYETDESDYRSTYLNIGLDDGFLMRCSVDPITGDLSDSRKRHLGQRAVRLSKMVTSKKDACLAISNRMFLNYMHQNRSYMNPVSYEPLEFADGLTAEGINEGIVGIGGDKLYILCAEKLGETFNQIAFPLQFTPRDMQYHYSGTMFIIETDNQVLSQAKSRQHKSEVVQSIMGVSDLSGIDLPDQYKEFLKGNEMATEEYGYERTSEGEWASCLRLLDVRLGTTLKHFELGTADAAYCCTFVEFIQHPGTQFLLVGCARGLKFKPHSNSGGVIYTFHITDGGTGFQFVHMTELEAPVYAICEFKGHALVGSGKTLQMFCFGKKKLLKKCENRMLINNISKISTIGQRIIVGDSQESIHFMKYVQKDNSIIVFCDETNPRYVTAMAILDYDTVVVGDKFGTISVLRLPDNVLDDADDDPSGVRAIWQKGAMNGASQKLTDIANFYVGDAVTSLELTQIIPQAEKCIVYGTISGSIGILVPFLSKNEHDFFQALEMHLRKDFVSLSGREHISYRSYYMPIKNVVDGDMCEQFNVLERLKQCDIAETFNKTINDVSKKLDDIRTRFAF